MRGVFVTGTDTGVGKSVVAAALLTALRGEGVDAVPMKPVQTGCVRRDQDWVAPDLELALSMTGLTPTAREREWMCPYRFEPACSPHLAAELAQAAELSLDRIVAAFDALAARHQAVVVEGAGGVRVPLNADRTMLDLMRILQLPVLLVARPGLGTINHTLLSLDALQRAGLTVRAVVLNATDASAGGYIEADNRRVIARQGGVPVLGPVSFVPGMEAETGNTAALLEAWRAVVPLTRILLEGA